MRRALLAVVALVATLATLALASSAGAQASQPSIAAASWYLVGDDGAVLARHDAARSRAIASITKLMTAIVVARARQARRRREREPAGGGDRRVDRLPSRGRGADRLRASACDAHPERERRRRGARASCRSRICRSFRGADERESGRAGSLRHALRESARPRRGRTRLERARRDGARALRTRHPVHPRCALARDAVASRRRTFETTDDLLASWAPLVAGKTGHTQAAGWSQTAAAQRGSTTVYGAVLGSDSRGTRNEALQQLLTYGLDQYRTVRVIDGARVYATATTGYGRPDVELVVPRGIARLDSRRDGRSSSASSRRRRSRFPWRRASASGASRCTTAIASSPRRPSSPARRWPTPASGRRRSGTRRRPCGTSGSWSRDRHGDHERGTRPHADRPRLPDRVPTPLERGARARRAARASTSRAR